MSEWRKVPGFEYQINIDTPQGRCRSLNYKGTGKVREISNNPKKDQGRINWGLSKDWRQVTQQAARWIALTFPELVQNEYFPGAHIDHIDTDRNNNHPSNLRWVTPKENNNNPLTRQHISKAGKGKHLNRPDLSKWVIQLSKNNEILHFFPSTKQAERETGVDNRRISACCLGKKVKDKKGQYYTPKTAGGFIWKYAE